MSCHAKSGKRNSDGYIFILYWQVVYNKELVHSVI